MQVSARLQKEDIALLEGKRKDTARAGECADLHGRRKGMGAGMEGSCPHACAHREILVIVLFFHLHETEHVIIDKMAMDSTDHEIGPRIGEKHNFNTVL
jgi:hypothetical protein